MNWVDADWDLKYNDAPVCPKCKKNMEDAWELSLKYEDDDTEIDCAYCDEPMNVMLHIKYSYSTWPVKKEEES